MLADLLCFLVGETDVIQKNFIWILYSEFDLNRLAGVSRLYAQLFWDYLSCACVVLHIALNLAIEPGQSYECPIAVWIKSEVWSLLFP